MVQEDEDAMSVDDAHPGLDFTTGPPPAWDSPSSSPTHPPPLHSTHPFTSSPSLAWDSSTVDQFSPLLQPAWDSPPATDQSPGPLSPPPWESPPPQSVHFSPLPQPLWESSSPPPQPVWESPDWSPSAGASEYGDNPFKFIRVLIGDGTFHTNKEQWLSHCTMLQEGEGPSLNWQWQDR
ncbi:hypothetical protein V8B97DRAFT_1917897 [Scleroderma yunnanense]